MVKLIIPYTNTGYKSAKITGIIFTNYNLYYKNLCSTVALKNLCSQSSHSTRLKGKGPSSFSISIFYFRQWQHNFIFCPHKYVFLLLQFTWKNGHWQHLLSFWLHVWKAYMLLIDTSLVYLEGFNNKYQGLINNKYDWAYISSSMQM